jgi:endonuclease/exonuclease/phosphatase family metal-dependent hydrolase
MRQGFRKFSKRIFIFIHIIVTAVFLLACLAAYVNPAKHWFIGLLGVGFIFFLLMVIAFFFFWLFFRSKWAWLSVATIAIGWFQIHALFGFHAFTKFDAHQSPGALRILQWNVTRWDEMSNRHKEGKSYRLKMFDYIKKQDADVLCFQEFFESKTPDFPSSNVPYITNILNYPYHYFVVDLDWWQGKMQHGMAIFSRYPIVDSSRVHYASTYKGKKGESLIRVTLNVNGQKINVFTTHLQSFQFKGEDYNNIEVLKRPEGNKGKLVQASKGIMYKFRGAYFARHVQADFVRKQLDSSAYPTIITGDFNDVPNSYTYFTVKGNYQDAFIKKGFGLGRTFYFISPTLRIDYILAAKEFKVLQYKRDLVPYSDHYPLVADIKIE